ncbi:MAG TPA: UDP-N-acetylmuramoyl-L-alanyl-D-glutamate--2,6-diaminopimelate ligase [Kofleriaceae bacterium]|nr:UDP-N-acetylmuramoyl-L-alanyl-D-glutamate--2,6-diaminopimelate ligase [Kofleriaceae bacterium]
MTLRQLIEGLASARIVGDAGVTVRAVHDDSRQVGPGDVFVAVKGMRSDGHDFVAKAIEQGAAAIVVERELDVKVPQVVVPSTTTALGALVGRSLGDPAAAMTLVGVTGTNGKTTTTYLVEAILAAAGHRPGVIGTVELRWPGHTEAASYTTPTPRQLHGTLVRMREAGCTHVVMEVTSIALLQERVAGMDFQVAAFSNLTQDHLDIHGTMDEYFAQKRRLFSERLKRGGVAVVNIDDPVGERIAQGCETILRVSADGTASEIRVAEQQSTVRGIVARIETPRGPVAIEAKPLIGHYNVANLALAVGIGEALGLSHDAIAKGIAELRGVPGRVERVPNGADLDIFVDYAHTPDALRNVLSALRPLTKRRLICVFGCGGDRDPTKRPKMGAAVAELADLAVVTSDNPRTEDPRAILDQILPAVPKPFFVDPDRRVAIRAAVAEATPGDVVCIAGKGHEDYQILGTTKVHFDDREEAAAAATEREVRLLVGLARDAEGAVESSGKAPAKPDATAETAIDRYTIDSRSAAPGSLYVAIRGETHDGHAFCGDAVQRGASAVMVERHVEVEVPQIRVTDTRLGIGKLAREHRRAWAKKLVAITGSAGKTTTKELTRAALAMAGTTHAAEGSLNNETGVPLTLLGLRLFHEYGVVEMGMRGLGQIEYLTKIAEPDIAVVVNAGTAHIELLGSTDAIAQAKSEIWIGLRPGGTVVLPAGDLRLETWARQHQPHARHVTFGEGDADVRLASYRPLDAGGVCELDVFGDRYELQLGLVGRHAAVDACAALAAAHAAGASIAQALAGIAKARPPAMRGEVVDVAGRKVIVDCYNANPASMAAAMRTLAERAQGKTAVAVIGDMLELGGHGPKAHDEVGALAKQLGISVIALGELAKHYGGEHVESPADAAGKALAHTKAGDWILLKASRGMRLERVLEVMRSAT